MTPLNPLQLNNILIIRPDMIGDCLLITPALALLRQKYPEAKIAVLARPYTKEIFINNPNVDEVIEDWFAEDRVESIRDFFNYVDFIKSKKFDCSIHFYNELPYALLALFAGIKVRIGDKSKPLIIPFYNSLGSCRWNDLTLHEVEHNILLLKPLGLALPDTPPPLQLDVPKGILEKLEAEYKISKNDLVVGIHLGTGRGNKAWLSDRYAKVIEVLAEKYRAKVVLTGSSKELASGREVMRLCKNKPINLIDKTTLSELIAIISRYNIYIGVDTGPLHIAAALKIPTVALFPTKFVKPAEWGPWQTRHVVIRKAVNCVQKCLPGTCPFDDCLKEITVDCVLDGVKTLLDNKGNKSLVEAKIDWFMKSANVFTNRDEIHRELSLVGYNVTDIGFAAMPARLMRQMIKDDINVIHWVGLSRPWALTAAKHLATPSLSVPPLLIYENVRYDISPGSLIELYKKRFTQ